MRIRELHPWSVSPAEARLLQGRLAPRVRIGPLGKTVRLVAGADLAFDRRRGLLFASVLVFSFPELELVDRADARGPLDFPYVPGLLTFREGPVLVQAFAALETEPDVTIFDGQGLAHPRRLGLACHMGLWLRAPAVGCAKSRLVGTHAEPGPRKGDSVPLMDGEEQIGVVLRTRDGVKPVYVSPGHLTDMESARGIVLECCRRYRLPEPTRQAHIAVGRLKAAAGGAVDWS